MEVRAAVVNLNDRTYEIRNGTGIGVFAPQFGPRRAFFGGIKWELPSSGPLPHDKEAARGLEVEDLEDVNRRSATELLRSANGGD